LVIHLRGTKENPKNAMDVIRQNQEVVKKNIAEKSKPEFKPKTEFKPKPKTDFKKKPFSPKDKKQAPKVQVVEKVQYKNGKNKKS
jgi:flagellar basal body rod protein FlgB